MLLYDELAGRVKDLEKEALDRNRIEEALRESEQRLSQIVDGNSIPTFVIDRDHVITHWNRACENLSGLSAREMVGTRKQWLAFYSVKRPVMADLVVENQTGKEMERYYSKYRKSDVMEGAYEAEGFFPDLGPDGKWLFFTASPLRGVNGKVAGAIETLQDITERKFYEERLRHFSEAMIRLQEEERSRVSRELHDELGQMLTALKFDVAWIERYLPDANSSLKTRYKAMCCLIDDSLDRIREISAGLRPGILDDMGLTAAIEWYTSEFQRRSDVECVVLLDLPKKRLQDHIETGIYRIVQEALTNVARHAKASVVTVRIKEDTGTIFLQIADNGTGIDAAKLQSPLSTGISGIQERAEILSATLQIKGIPGNGTQINLRIPAR